MLLCFIRLLLITATAVVISRAEDADEILPAGIQHDLQVHISPTGKMVISVDKEPWLVGGSSPLQVNGWPDLSILSVKANDGHDPKYGSFRRHTLVWGSSNKAFLETSVVAYLERELVLLEQSWLREWSSPTTSDASNTSSNKTILASFPSIQTMSPVDLNFLTWGDCFVCQPSHGKWDGTQHADLFNGDTHGEPLLLHKKTATSRKTTRAIVLSPMTNFFVSGQAASPDGTTIDCGIRNTVQSIPKGFSHASVLVAGHGINGTLMDWGDVLLGISGKKRTDPYKNDFVLSHLGYWTDNGAYYYHGVHTNYPNAEEALKAVKADYAKRHIPVRYYQWDDWWMESKGDIPGMTSWKVKPDVFPSGFSDWLGMPLSMYAPEYSSENDWMDTYHFKTDPNGQPTAIPLDPNFYQDLFRNGTAIGMKMFEQDFLCSYGIGGTGLTNTDVDSGRLWMKHMDAAALATGTTVQFCMMNAYHALHSTLMKSMTNGRATGDNTRNYDSIQPMGQTGLLFYALGFFASRDNVWSTSADKEQPGCGNRQYCVEPNAHADNAVAVLSGGPYGIADAVGYTNRTIVMYACREGDGVLLRPRWPLASLDFTFTDEDAMDALVWAAHDEYGLYRWSYIVGINLDKDVSITPERLQGIHHGKMVAWKVQVGVPVANVIPLSDGHPLVLPAQKRPPKGPSLAHWVAAPILPNGMAILGEGSKWATMSFRRVARLQADRVSIKAVLVGAPGEKTVFGYTPSGTLSVSRVGCNFGESHDCAWKDKFGNTDCLLMLTCTHRSCICGPIEAPFFVNDDFLRHGSLRQQSYTVNSV